MDTHSLLTPTAPRRRLRAGLPLLAVLCALAGTGVAQAQAPATALSLADTQQRLIGEALQANGGNVARTARQLGVSRGLVYRHLRK